MIAVSPRAAIRAAPARRRQEKRNLVLVRAELTRVFAQIRSQAGLQRGTGGAGQAGSAESNPV